MAKTRKTQSKIQKRRLRFQRLNRRELLAGDLTNPWNELDVNNDDSVTASDALGIINYMGRQQSLAEGEAHAIAFYPDTTGEGEVTARDALRVINGILAEGENDFPASIDDIEGLSIDFGSSIDVRFSGNAGSATVSSTSAGLVFSMGGASTAPVPFSRDLRIRADGDGNTLVIDGASIPDDLIIDVKGTMNRVRVVNSSIGDDFILRGGGGMDGVVLDSNTSIGDDLVVKTKEGNDIVAMQGVSVGDDALFYLDDGEDQIAFDGIVIGDDLIARLGDHNDFASVNNAAVDDVADIEGDRHTDAIAAANVNARRVRIDEFETNVDLVNVDELTNMLFPEMMSPVMPMDDASLSIDQGATALSLSTGQSVNLTFAVNVGMLTDPVITSFAQSIEGEPDGLTITSDHPVSGWSDSEAITHLVNQTFTAVTPGTYTVTTMASFDDQTESATETLTVVVEDANTPPVQLVAPGVDVAGLPSGADSSVLFTSSVIGDAPDSIEIVRTTADGDVVEMVATLRDDGSSGDATAGDGIYSAQVTIPSADEGVLHYVTRTQFNEMTVSSPVSSVYVTPLPIGLSDNDSPVVSNDTGEQWLEGQILVGLGDGVSSARIQEIATQFNAEILGVLPRLNMLLIDVPVDQFDAALTAIGALDDVEYAHPNAVGEFTTIAPDSASEAGDILVRADEAAIVAQKGLTVVVLDSGVDATHPDLAGRVINGPDFGDDDSDSTDELGHGTFVAGVVAASRNGVGATGLSSGNVISVKVNSGTQGPSASAVVEGFDYVANLGQRVVVNASFRISWFSSFLTGLSSAVSAAQSSSLVVAAAGNNGASSADRPARYSGVLGVGSSTSGDTRASFSNFGSGVDIAAPGVNVFSTEMGGGYGSDSGTSFSSPAVAAAAAVVWNQHPTWSAQQVSNHLIATAEPLSGSQIGPRLDLFEAVFNGSFEANVEGWDTEGTVSGLNRVGPLSAQVGERMAQLSTGPAADGIAASLSQTFTAQPGATSVGLEIRYAFLTEEFDEFVDTEFDDLLSVNWIGPGGSDELISESVNTSSFTFLSGIDLAGGDETLGWTGWKTFAMTLPVSPGDSYTLDFDVTDTGDDVFDTIVLVDGIKFKA